MQIQNLKFKILKFFLNPIPYSLKARAGFTLVESLVAITIVLISVVGPLSVISKTLSFSYSARDEIIAFYLAQDGVEYVRNVRDKNLIAGNAWLTGLSSCTGGSLCAVDSVADTITACVSSCELLKISSSGVYGYTNGDNTVFTREISLDETVANRETILVVTVRWTQGLLTRNVTLREHIFNWD